MQKSVRASDGAEVVKGRANEQKVGRESVGGYGKEDVENRKFEVFFFFFKQKTAYEMRLSLVGSEMVIRDRYHAK